jgi:hypothetical protein
MMKTTCCARKPVCTCLVRLIPAILLFLPGNVPADAADLATGSIYACTFTAGNWNQPDWVRVKYPQGEHFGSWVQQEGCIANAVPSNATAEELQGRLAAETYSCMVYKERITGDVSVASTMSFAYKMAPLILLTPAISENAKGQKQCSERFEIVIFDEGVNVWRHFVKDGTLTYRKAAFASFRLEKDTKYRLEVKKTGKTLTVSVAGHTFGYIDDALPESFFVGITGCEGLNRFYDFSLRRPVR